MKKLIALLLAMIMVCSLATVAFADETSYTDAVAPSTSTTEIKLNKLFTITGALDVAGNETNEIKAVYPHETLSFTVAGNDANPNGDMISVADLEIAYIDITNTVGGTMAITLPAYTEVGKYVYTVSETAGNAQAATYSTGTIGLTVLVEYNEAHTGLEATLYLTQTDATTGQTQTSEIEVGEDKVAKVDTFLNTYTVGQLDVSKTVSGNLASQEEEFEMTVTFTSANPVMSDITVMDGSSNEITTIVYGEGWTTHTETINVKHGETVSFYNIPVGVTYVVEEAAKHGVGNDGFDANSADDTDYTVEYDENKTGTISTATSSTTVKNTKETTVDTGVALDSAPYIVMLVVAMVGVVALVSKKRYEV